DDPNSKGSYTYSDAMNEWATEQDSFFRRARTGILHPSAASSGFYRLLGYAWRLFVVAIILLVIGYVGVRRYIKSSEFSNSLATQASALLEAEETKLRPFSWKGSNAISAEFSAVGAQQSFFASLAGTYLQFERPLLSLFSPAWKFTDIRIDHLTLNLRSGGIGVVPDLPSTNIDDLPEFPSDFIEPNTSIDTNPDSEDSPDPLGMDLRIKSSGYGINPDFSQLTFDSLSINKLDATWGLTPLTRGSLTGAVATVTRENDAWTLTAASGTLNQRWLRDMKLSTPLAVIYRADSITFSPCELTFNGTPGTAKLGGQIKTGDIPTLDFDLSVNSVRVGSLLSQNPAAADLIAGTIAATGKVAGSTNTGDGVTISLDASLHNGHFANIPLLAALASQTGHSPFRQLPIAGTLKIATTASTTSFSDLALTSGDNVMIGGSFTVTTHDADPKPADYPAGIPYTPAAPDYAGTLKIGLAPDLLARHPEVRDRHFKEDSGMFWIDVPLDGKLKTLTREQTDQLVTAFRNTR
ncbi:MAG: hypothetical protein P8J87_13560, partial [Verrucomicrobiales bacterium]|nr:hypothetical protein [Verrucomicrobiales bacterium]